VFLSDAGNRAWLSEQINAGITNVEEFADNLLTMSRDQSRKHQQWLINHLQKKYGLSDAQRQRLHRAITKQGYSDEEIEEIAEEMAQEKGGERPRGDNQRRHKK
ncbi:MAG: hypothetical protein MI924_20100, partial [Chloroflexales bacterium]|nr:hypothetical protein [Chloroflexales bacterium]